MKTNNAQITTSKKAQSSWCLSTQRPTLQVYLETNSKLRGRERKTNRDRQRQRQRDRQRERERERKREAEKRCQRDSD